MKKRITATILAVLLILCAFAGCAAKNENQTPSDALIGSWSFEGGMTLEFSKGEAGYKFVLTMDGMGSVDGIYLADGSVLTLNYVDGTLETLDYVFEDNALIINGSMVFEKTAGGVNTEKLTAVQILIYSAVGFLVVFAVLFVLFIVITLQGKIFDSTAKKTETVTEETQSVPEDEVLLVNTDDESAAMIMAIVAEETGIPIEELYFKSIRQIEEGEDVK